MKPANRNLRLVAIPLVLLVAISLAAGWWTMRPHRAADRFMSLISQGQFEAADAMLTGQSSLREQPSGELVIVDQQGRAATIRRDELPLRPLDSFYYQPRPTNADYLAGRYHFPLAAAGPLVRSEAIEPRVVSAIATPRGIIIDSVSK